MEKTPVPVRSMTDKQQAIYDHIKSSIEESKYPPTVREIADKFEITVKGAYDHLKAIEKKGYIKTEQNKSRAIVILNHDGEQQDSPSVTIPLLGRIAAGTPILAQENVEEYLSFPKGAFGSGTLFALTVKGDSMIDAGILDGDIAIIKKQERAENGDIIAVLTQDEATLKRFKRTGDKGYLVPENKAYNKFLFTDDMVVMGRLSGIFRVC